MGGAGAIGGGGGGAMRDGGGAACAICGGPVTWVHGYIKGPDDKPLRLHDKTLYRLSR